MLVRFGLDQLALPRGPNAPGPPEKPSVLDQKVVDLGAIEAGLYRSTSGSCAMTMSEWTSGSDPITLRPVGFPIGLGPRQ